MLNAIYHHIRHHHPIWYFALLIAALLVLVGNLANFAASNTDLLNNLGAGRAKEKIVAAREFAYWRYRAWRHDNNDAPPPHRRYHGSMQSTNRDGTINITIIDEGQYKTERVILADTIILDPIALAPVVAMQKNVDAEFDFYLTDAERPYAVAWIDGKPFNVQIILAGIARPDIDPPTNIVDKAFASYYWTILTR